MLVQILNKLKNRNFWAGVATTVAGSWLGPYRPRKQS